MSTEGLLGSVGPSIGSRSLLRRMNSLGLLNRLTDKPRTSAELVEASGLSRTAVDGVLADLAALGWLETHDAPTGRLGRPATLFGLKADLGVLVSLDIGANHIHAVLANLSGPVITRTDVRVGEDDPTDRRLQRAAELVDELLAAAGRARDSLWVLSVGSPGSIIDGVVRHYGGAGMPGWIGMDLRRWFEDRFSAAVVVEGDVALGAEAELAFGAAQGVDDVVYVLSGVRTSGALVIGGRVHRGVHGAAGIVGELPQLRWAELGTDWTGTHGGWSGARREDIFARAREGSHEALLASDEFATALATGAAALVLAIDPELLVIGGGASPSADVFLPRFSEVLAALCPSVPTIAASVLGSEAVALGGLSLGRRRLAAALEASVRSENAFLGPAGARELVLALSRPAG